MDKNLMIPDGTVFEERAIVTKGQTDVIVGDHAQLHYGVITQGRMFMGSRAIVTGNVEVGDDIRIDSWSSIDGDVSGGRDVHLGERVGIDGCLSVGRDLDVGDDVQLKGGFEAHGWINIRDPVPLVIYLFIYLIDLLGMGRGKEVEEILLELEEEDEDILVGNDFLLIPANAVVGLEHSTIPGGGAVGEDCKLLGNYSIGGPLTIGVDTSVYGTVRVTGDATLGPGSLIYGDLWSDGNVSLGEGARVEGEVKAQGVEMYRSTVIKGEIRASWVRIHPSETRVAIEKLEQYPNPNIEGML